MNVLLESGPFPAEEWDIMGFINKIKIIPFYVFVIFSKKKKSPQGNNNSIMRYKCQYSVFLRLFGQWQNDSAFIKGTHD